MKINIPSYVSDILSTLENAGYSAFSVGGCVRDSIMSRTVSDYDLCTSALPEQIIDVFGTENTIPTGMKHGTVTVKSGKGTCEVTTFRIESGYSDFRHPDSVAFTDDITADLSRRDFTVNAMAYSEKTGLVDPFFGRDDIVKRVIRTVGSPKKRFQEDALRIMRALRFSSVLGFEIEKETAQAVMSGREQLKNVSVERLFAEYEKLICGERATEVLDRFREVAACVIPELSPLFGFDQKSRFHDRDAFTHTLCVVKEVPREPVIRTAALFHDIAKPLNFTEDSLGRHFAGHAQTGAEISEKILYRLKTPRRFREDVCCLVREHEHFTDVSQPEILLLAGKLGPIQAKRLFVLQRADALAHAPEYAKQRCENSERSLEILENALSTHEPFRVSDLDISGSELNDLPLKQKSDMSILLERLLYEVIQKSIPNERRRLLERAAELIKTGIYKI